MMWDADIEDRVTKAIKWASDYSNHMKRLSITSYALEFDEVKVLLDELRNRLTSLPLRMPSIPIGEPESTYIMKRGLPGTYDQYVGELDMEVEKVKRLVDATKKIFTGLYSPTAVREALKDWESE